MYAQTNIQLFDQLHRASYSTGELRLICDAHDLAMKLFTGLYRPSGKTFIAHLVGTASILGTLHTSAKVVAAGLLHAAYMYGDFGDGTNRISPWKREQVRRTVGSEVEEYVSRYTALRWTSKTIPAIYENFQELGPIDRDVLLIRLANELDDLLDLGVLYCFKAESKRHHHVRFAPVLVEMAEKLGFPDLAAELTRALAETASAEIFAELRSRKPGVILIAPRSYCRRTRLVLHQELSRGFHVLRSAIGGRKKLNQFVYRVFRLRSAVSFRTKHQQSKETYSSAP